MSSRIETYCHFCDKSVTAQKEAREETILVRNDPYEVMQDVIVCEECENRIEGCDTEEGNLQRAYDAHRDAHSLLSPEEIKQTYSDYGLSQASFCKMLNLGAATISRYENGSLQTKQIDSSIRSAGDPQRILALLESNKASIPANQYKKAVSIARSRLDGAATEPPQMIRANFQVFFGCLDTPCAENGYRVLDRQKIVEAALFFASKCKDFYLVRFNKAFFYADMNAYAITSKSITGLQYANAPQGPIINGYDILKGILADGKNLDVEVHYFGNNEAAELIALREPDMSVFSADEQLVMENTANFLNSFRTSKELSDYTHREKAWIETVPGQTIDYSYAFDLIEESRILEGID